MRKIIPVRTTIIKMIQKKEIDRETVLAKMKIEHGFSFNETDYFLNEMQNDGLIFIDKYVEIQEDWKESTFAEKYFKGNIKRNIKEHLKNLFYENKH